MTTNEAIARVSETLCGASNASRDDIAALLSALCGLARAEGLVQGVSEARAHVTTQIVMAKAAAK